MPRSDEADFAIYLPPTTYMNQYPERSTWDWSSDWTIEGELDLRDGRKRVFDKGKNANVYILTRNVPAYVHPDEGVKDSGEMIWFSQLSQDPYHITKEWKRVSNALSLRGFFDGAVVALENAQIYDPDRNRTP